MIRKMIAVVISLCCFIVSAEVQAAIDRTHVIFTNNTSAPLTLHANVVTDDHQFQKGIDWDGASLTLEPYQSKEVLWIVRNQRLKMHYHYQFNLFARHPDFNNENVLVSFDAKAKLIFGSDVTSYLTLPREAQQIILTNNGLYQFPVHTLSKDYIVHARRWRPMLNGFDNYHIVIDQPEKTTPSAPKNSQLSVLSYNTQLMPFYGSSVNDLNQPELRVRDIPPKIADYDVVVLQELLDHDLRNKITNEMGPFYPFHTHVVGEKTLLPCTGGVMIFSKWPILKEEQIVFSQSTGLDKLAAKGVIYAAINKNGKLFHIFGTHTVAGGQEEDIRARTSELMEMENFIARMNIPFKEPVIIAGDFNINQFSNEIQLLLSTLHVNLSENIGYPYSTDALVDTMNNGHDRNRLDFVFYSNLHVAPELAYNKVIILRALDDEAIWPKFDLSDHFPVAAYFQFTE